MFQNQVTSSEIQLLLLTALQVSLMKYTLMMYCKRSAGGYRAFLCMQLCTHMWHMSTLQGSVGS